MCSFWRHQGHESLLFKLNKNTWELVQVFMRAGAWGVNRGDEHQGLFQPAGEEQRDPEQHTDGATWHRGRPLVTTTSMPCSGYRERGEKRAEKVTWGQGEREGERWRGRECCLYEQRVQRHLPSPLMNRWRDFTWAALTQEGRRGWGWGGGGELCAQGQRGWFYPALSLFLPSLPVQSVTHIRSKLSG